MSGSRPMPIQGKQRTKTRPAGRRPSGTRRLVGGEKESSDELLNASRALRETESELAAIYENAPLLMLLVDAKGRVRKANKAAAAFADTDATRLQRRGLGEVLRCVNASGHARGCGWGAACRQCVIHQTVRDTFRTGGSHEQEEASVQVLNDRGRQTATFLVSTARLTPSEESHVLVTLLDITARKAAELALRETNERLKKVLEVETVGVMFWDANTGTLIDANDTFLTLVGYSRDELSSGQLTWQKLTPPEFVDVSLAELKKFQTTGRIGPYEKEYLRKDGTRCWFIFAGSSLGHGKLVEFCVDVSSHKRSEAALKQAQRLACLGFWEWDLQTGQHNWSEETYRIYGRDPKLPAPAYAELKQYLTEESWQRVSAALDRGLAEGTAFACDAELVRPDGTRRWVTARGQSSRDAAGKVLTLYGTVQDITERKQFEHRIAQLSRAQAILAAVDHAIVHIQDQQQLLDEICRVAVAEGGFKLVWVGMAAPDGSVRPVAQAGAVEFLRHLRVTVRDEPQGRGPVGTSIRENRPVIVEDVELDPRMAPWRERAGRLGLRYVAAFPLRIGNRAVGSLQAYAPRAGFFDEKEVRLLSQLSEDISFALTALEAVAQRKRADEELRKSEQELADFFAASPLGLLWVAPDGRVLRVNRAELELLGRESAEVLGHSICEAHVEPQIARDVLARVARKETVQNLRTQVRAANSTIKHVLIDANGFWEQGQLVHSRWFVRDITDRVALEREILTVSEREQRRFGHDLHDDLCQQLAGIQFLSQTLASELEARSLGEASAAKEIAESVQQTMAQTRELARGLAPVSMEARGLMEALRQLAARTRKIFRLDCRFRCPSPVLVPDHGVAIHLYRIAQEAVGNAVKHGQPGAVEIGLEAADSSLRLKISDNGAGLPPQAVKSKGLGLRIMRYRAGVIGGSLVLQRNPSGGTAVICTVPEALRPAQARSTA